jgi:hypothetical protein
MLSAAASGINNSMFNQHFNKVETMAKEQGRSLINSASKGASKKFNNTVNRLKKKAINRINTYGTAAPAAAPTSASIPAPASTSAPPSASASPPPPSGSSGIPSPASSSAPPSYLGSGVPPPPPAFLGGSSSNYDPVNDPSIGSLNLPETIQEKPAGIDMTYVYIGAGVVVFIIIVMMSMGGRNNN